MNKKINLIFLILFINISYNSVMSFWDFAVTTKSKIIFYDDKWNEINTAAHQFDELSAITFDETEEKIYFNDQAHNNGSIFSLKIPLDDTKNENNEIIEKIVKRVQNETIGGIAYDPLYQNIYWTDILNKKIFIMSMTDNQYKNKPKIFINFQNEETIPDGIAIDICSRKLYWTNSNHKSASIESVNLDEMNLNRKIIIDKDLYLPHGIIVDQFLERLYWVVDQQGSHFSVESSKLDGTDRKTIVRGLNNVPFNLAVTKNSIYWTDLTHNAIWTASKKNLNETKDNNDNDDNDNDNNNNDDNGNKPTKIKNLLNHPKGIISRNNYLTKLENSNNNCKNIIKNIKTRILNKNVIRQQKSSYTKVLNIQENFCLNNGEYNSLSDNCICKVGYKGRRCETSECNNLCVHGTCEIYMGFPECICDEGYYGERCEKHKCTNYCLNDGKCEINNALPTCNCQDRFSGLRCESNSTEICALLCQMLKYEPNINLPFGCYDVCEELQESIEFVSKLKKSRSDAIDSCRMAYNRTILLIVFGIVLAITLVFLTVITIRKIYKPMRPRIKKTFLVQKKMSQTPLTSRPVATEQCEITIEDCCNMNICDTPCFDPKLLQQFDSNCNNKDDKKILIDNMEEDLY